MEHLLPWDLAPQLPWHVFTSPAHKWAEQPSFVVGEWVILACAALAFVHAWRQAAGAERRRHLVAWVAALIAGTSNDVIFMALPMVDNFWQAQGTVMLTPRLPLYIPGMYIFVIYPATVAVWRLRLPPLARAALSGLAAIAIYAPYDIIGAKFMWWTWHDTDLPIANRLLGVPVGSTMWVITLSAGFAWLLGRVLDRDPAVSQATIAKALIVTLGLSTVLMVLQVTILQFFDGGIPGARGLVVLLAAYAVVAWRGWRHRQPAPPRPADRILQGATILYFATLVLVMAVFDPGTERSTGVHQTYGPCHVQTKLVTGLRREKFLCAEAFSEDFSFACTDRLPAAGSQWYTICGRPHTSFPRYLLTVAALALAGALLYAHLLRALRRR
jgi:hypothetical protein